MVGWVGVVGEVDGVTGAVDAPVPAVPAAAPAVPLPTGVIGMAGAAGAAAPAAVLGKLVAGTAAEPPSGRLPAGGVEAPLQAAKARTRIAHERVTGGKAFMSPLSRVGDAANGVTGQL